MTETFYKMDDLLIDPKNNKELMSFKNEKSDGGAGTGESMAGCTANVVLIVNNTIYVANAGNL